MIVISLLAIIALLVLLFAPQFWINWTLRKHANERPDMPGTGGELARLLLDEAGLQTVAIDVVETGDHYSPDDRAVRLSKANFTGKSITAVAVAAHEVAHAIQHRDGFGPLMWRQRLVKKAIAVERIGSLILITAPVFYALIRNPLILGLEIAVALGIFASSILIHFVTLPTEFDASFRKALPVLSSYVPPEEMPGVRSVLRAAAFTYVAGALVSLLSAARWFRILRF
jgi:uncharacterized protein